MASNEHEDGQPVGDSVNVLVRISDLHDADCDGIAWLLNLDGTTVQPGSHLTIN